MNCSRPIWIKRSDGLRREVPCGHCTMCRIQRAREWATRCIHEAVYTESSAFCTLTYDEESLPKDCSVSKDELQRFFKRLRKLWPVPLRYYACGEYGEVRGRPHYHAIIFGLPPCDCPDWPENERGKLQRTLCKCEGRRAVMKAWPFGGVSRLTLVCYDSARYTADYIGKAYNGDLATRYYGTRQVPFQIMSKGLGRGYIS